MRCPACQTSVSDGARFCGACGRPMVVSGPSYGGAAVAPAPAFADDVIGNHIAGRYRILSKLGQGGMGAVYRAEQISLKRIIALKLLRNELSQNPGIVQRFNKEAELAARLNHPNTVTLFDFGQDSDGALFIAMELVDGTSLRNVLLREGALTQARALHIAEQVALSLADAHGHGIVHRDLKPDNVMLRTQGKRRDVVTVLDFGIAKLRDEGDDGAAVPVTRAGDLLGTPQYMAPEQIRADKVDGRTDVYALGAMLYEMITGRLPFQGATVMAILSKHLTEVAVAPEVLRPDLSISAGLSGLIMQALEKSPDARPDSMESMAERIGALKRVAGGERRSSSMLTRPPGVPLSLPGTAPNPLFDGPGLASAVPLSTGAPANVPVSPAMTPGPGPSPMTAQSSAGPVPQAMTPPPFGGAPTPNTMTPAPSMASSPGASSSSRGGRMFLYVAGGVAVAAAIVAAVALGGGREGKATKEGTDPGGSSSDTTTDVEPARPIFSKHGDVGGLEWRNPGFPYALVLPPGFTPELVGNPANVRFVSATNGQSAWIVAMASVANTPTTSDAELMAGVQALANTYQGVVLSQAFTTVQGKRRLMGVIDVPTLGTRYEFALYTESNLTLMVLYGTTVKDFDGTAAERREMFQKRVRLVESK